MDAPSSAAFYPRLLTSAIREALADTPVVCLLGPRQSGKTTLVRELLPDRDFISLDDGDRYRTAMLESSAFVATLPDAVTLDEVQRVPALLPAIKLSVDHDRRPGRFLLTGSANLLLMPDVTESLAGRMEILYLLPLTEAEKERRPGHFLRDWLEGGLKPRIRSVAEPGRIKVVLSSLANRLVAGGYPEPLTRLPTRARQWHRQYLNGIIKRDVRGTARVRDADELARLLELLALRNAELLNVNNLANDLGLHRETVGRYVAVLERLFLVRRLPAWHHREAARLIKSPKIFVLDSGLAATLAGLEAEDWFNQRERMGHLLEAFVVQQLIAQAAWTDPDLRFYHYRDKDQVEVDLVITRGRKVWGVEVKASSSFVESDGRGLARLAARCGKDFQSGVVLYAGEDTLPMRDKRMLAVPVKELWER